ncbi:hypothetical protein ABW21_db0203757 [Orbilia brochopaga]|nr:hypothetical protein ABW21_db0203757 [Drechslerella brochopaga]
MMHMSSCKILHQSELLVTEFPFSRHPLNSAVAVGNSYGLYKYACNAYPSSNTNLTPLATDSIQGSCDVVCMSLTSMGQVSLFDPSTDLCPESNTEDSESNRSPHP